MEKSSVQKRLDLNQSTEEEKGFVVPKEDDGQNLMNSNPDPNIVSRDLIDPKKQIEDYKEDNITSILPKIEGHNASKDTTQIAS